jgi:uncharacterized protein (DUF2236 family)
VAAKLPSLSGAIKRRIIGEVRRTFHDSARGEGPVQRREDGLFGPQSIAWRVHGDVTSMMVGGITALLMQMLHPAVLAGVWDHSNFREDMIGRLRRTARFIALTTYGSRDEAHGVIERVRSIHHHVHGILADGTPYTADDPALLAWVHVTEAWSFLAAWVRYAEPAMALEQMDRYFAEVARIGHALGAAPIPTTLAQAEAQMAERRTELVADSRSSEVASIVLSQPARTMAARPAQALTMQAAVDLLPGWAREMHGLSDLAIARPLIRAGTFGMASALRWAFR